MFRIKKSIRNYLKNKEKERNPIQNSFFEKYKIKRLEHKINLLRKDLGVLNHLQKEKPDMKGSNPILLRESFIIVDHLKRWKEFNQKNEKLTELEKMLSLLQNEGRKKRTIQMFKEGSQQYVTVTTKKHYLFHPNLSENFLEDCFKDINSSHATRDCSIVFEEVIKIKKYKIPKDPLSYKTHTILGYTIFDPDLKFSQKETEG